MTEQHTLVEIALTGLAVYLGIGIIILLLCLWAEDGFKGVVEREEREPNFESLSPTANAVLTCLAMVALWFPVLFLTFLQVYQEAKEEERKAEEERQKWQN